MVRKQLLILLLSSLCLSLGAQAPHILNGPDSLSLDLRHALQDHAPAHWQSAALKWLQKEGYWLAQVEVIDSNAQTYLRLKDLQAYRIGELQLTRISSKDTLSESLSPAAHNTDAAQVEALLKARLAEEQEKGYPFARLEWQHYEIRAGRLEGAALLYAGPEIRLDSVTFRGDYSLDQAMLRYDLNFQAGMLFRESYLQEIQSLSQQLEYLEWQRPPAVAFFRSKTTLYLYPAKSRNNRIDGVIGLNTSSTGTSTLNGDFQLRLLNTLLKKGEEIDLQWRRPDASVQELNLALQSPYLFGWPLKLGGVYNLFRQDSSFIKTELEPRLTYSWQRDLQFELSYRYRSSNPLSGESSLVNLSAIRAHFFSLGFRLRQTDRLLVPRRGYRLELSLFNGRRFRDNLGQDQYGWRGLYQYYQPLLGQLGLLTGLRSEGLMGGNLALNELYRIGGLRTLRGFNEQSIFASGYAIGTLELRYALGELDYLSLFSDLAYLQSQESGLMRENLLTGLGTGINFQTQGGVFSLFFAVGRSRTRTFDFGATKVHFGYTNRF